MSSMAILALRVKTASRSLWISPESILMANNFIRAWSSRFPVRAYLAVMDHANHLNAEEKLLLAHIRGGPVQGVERRFEEVLGKLTLVRFQVHVLVSHKSKSPD